MTRFIYDRITKNYNTLNHSLKNPFYCQMINHNVKNNDIKEMKSLEIILELIGEQNDIEFETSYFLLQVSSLINFSNILNLKKNIIKKINLIIFLRVMSLIRLIM